MRWYQLFMIGLLLCLFAVPSISLTSAQVREQQAGLARATDQPQLAVDFSRVAKLKIASRKHVYRIGEMLSLDVALLNTSTTPIYFPQLASGHSFFRDPTGREKSSTAYINLDTMPVAQSYLPLGANKVTLATIQLSVGCDPQAFVLAKARLRSVIEGKRVFDDDLFVTWGESCLDIKKAGTYTVTFELSNLLVVVSPETSSRPTGTGTLKSNDLTFTIVK